MREKSEVPECLSPLADRPGVLVRRAGALRKDARCVVYWMQRAMRVWDNPALNEAIEAGNILGLPVVIYFGVIPNYPNANLRPYHFLQQGLRDVADDASELGVALVVRRPPDRLEAFLEEVGAAMLVGDENPCREPERCRQALSKRLKIPFWTVDADVVVPSRVFNRSFVLLHHFRPHLKAELPKFLVDPDTAKPEKRWKIENLRSFDLAEDITAGFKKLDRSVKPVDTFTGGAHAARKLLDEFVQHKLADYDTENRNHPETDGTSRLSPYLHFGNIGPLTIASAVRKAAAQKIPAATVERYLEQLIGWRELAVLFVRHEPNYDNWECAAPWARKSLLEHTADPRPVPI